MRQVTETLFKQACLHMYQDNPCPDTDLDVSLNYAKPGGGEDYVSNLALVLAGSSRNNPQQIAENLISKLPYAPFLEKVEINGNGLIRFYVRHTVRSQIVHKVLEQKSDPDWIPNGGILDDEAWSLIAAVYKRLGLLLSQLKLQCEQIRNTVADGEKIALSNMHLLAEPLDILLMQSMERCLEMRTQNRKEPLFTHLNILAALVTTWLNEGTLLCPNVLLHGPRFYFLAALRRVLGTGMSSLPG